MAHVDDLTLVSAAQLQETDELYVGRPSDPADPDRRTLLGSLAGFMGEHLPDDTDFLDALISRIIGPESPSDLLSRVEALEGLGLMIARKQFATTNPSTVYFTDADIPRNGAGLVLLSGNTDGGAVASWYRHGRYNGTTGLGWGASKTFAGTSESSTGAYRFWIEDQTAGARLVARAHTGVGRSITVLALETPY